MFKLTNLELLFTEEIIIPTNVIRTHDLEIYSLPL